MLIVKKVAQKFGYFVDIVHREERREVKHAYCDYSKAKSLLNFIDRTELGPLVNYMFEWAITQPKRKVKSMKNEISKNIYEFWS